MGKSLERGLARGFAGAAEMVKMGYAAKLQARHSEALERIRHQYRMTEGAQGGLIAGQTAGKKHERALELEDVRAGHAMEREKVKGQYDLQKQMITSAGKNRAFPGFGGNQYSATDIVKIYENEMEYGTSDEYLGPIEWAKKYLGVDLTGLGVSEAEDPGAAGKAAVEESEKTMPPPVPGKGAPATSDYSNLWK